MDPERTIKAFFPQLTDDSLEMCQSAYQNHDADHFEYADI